MDQYDPIPPIQLPRGYGGVAIFWKKDIDYLVNDLEIGSQRIKCIELQTEKVSKVAKIRNRYNQVPHLTHVAYVNHQCLHAL